MGDLCKQAQNYLERAKGTELDARHEAEKANMAAEMADMRQKLEMLMQGGVAPAKAAAKPAASSRPSSAFDSWEPDDIRAWVKDVIKQHSLTEEEPHHKAGKAKLIEIADRIAAKLQADQSVAA